MKKLNLLLLACMAIFAFSSCSDDDDEPADQIIGKWKYAEITASVECDNALVKEYIEKQLKKYGDAEGNIIEFSDNGTIKDSDGDITKYSIKGDKITIYETDKKWDAEKEEYVDIEYSNEGTISISGNTLTLVIDKIANYQGEGLKDILSYVKELNPNANIPDDVKVTKAVYTIKYTKQ